MLDNASPLHQRPYPEKKKYSAYCHHNDNTDSINNARGHQFPLVGKIPNGWGFHGFHSVPMFAHKLGNMQT